MLRLICIMIGLASVALAADAMGTGRLPAQPTQGQATANPAGAPHQIFIGVRGTVLAIDRTNGQELWRSSGDTQKRPMRDTSKPANGIRQDKVIYNP